MNLSDTARLRILTLQRAVVYDGDAARAERVADVLRTLGLEPLLIDHSALMRAVIQAPHNPPALLVGDVAAKDLAAALLRNQRIYVSHLSWPGREEGALRISVHVFNTHEEIDRLIEGLRQQLPRK